MKKRILSMAVLVAALIVAIPSQAQVKFGVKAGLNVNSVSLKGDLTSNLSADNRTGFFAGLTADVTIPLAGLGADISVLYDNKVVGVSEMDLIGEEHESNKTLHYVDLPINLKYTVGFSSLASVYLATGPQFSWNVGAGATVLKHVRVGYNYNIGIGKTAEMKWITAGEKAIKGKLKNNTHQISLTYLF